MQFLPVQILTIDQDESRLMETSCGTPSMLTYGNLVGNTYSTHGHMASPGDRDLEETTLIEGDTLATVTVNTQLSNSHRLLTVRTSYREALGYERLYYRHSYSRYANREALNDRLRAPPLGIHAFRKSRGLLALTCVSAPVSPCLPEGWPIAGLKCP